MNILIGNTQEFNPEIGGVERVSTTLADIFSKNGHSVFFFSCLKSPYSKPYKPVVEQFILPNKIYDSTQNKQMLNALCIEKKIDIILNQAGNILEFTKLCADTTQKLHIPLVSAIHTNPMNRISVTKDYKFSSIYFSSYFKGILRFLLMPIRYWYVYYKEHILYNEICSLSDKVILLSELYKYEFDNLTKHLYSNKISSIANPNGFKPEFDLGLKEKIVLFVGRLDFNQKRPDRLIRIWEKIYQDFPEWKLKLVGDGPSKNQLINYINNKKIQNVEFLGFCDSREYYKTASILCLTSSIEGLPMVLIEGISFGCIPISYDSFNSIHDIIEENINGYIVKSYSYKDYNKKLRFLLTDIELRKRLSNMAFITSRKFEVKSIAMKWIKSFEDLISEYQNE